MPQSPVTCSCLSFSPRVCPNLAFNHPCSFSENSEICPDDTQGIKANPDEVRSSFQSLSADVATVRCASAYLRAALRSASPRFSSHIFQYSVLSFVLTVAMVSLLPGQLPGVLHPQPAEQRDPEHAEETLSDFRQSRGLQSHHLQRVSLCVCVCVIESVP